MDINSTWGTSFIPVFAEGFMRVFVKNKLINRQLEQTLPLIFELRNILQIYNHNAKMKDDDYMYNKTTDLHDQSNEEFSSKIKQIHYWYFWEKRVSLTEFLHMSIYGKTKFRLKAYLRELSGSKFHSVTSSNVILYNHVKNSIYFLQKWIYLVTGTELFKYCRITSY